MNHQKIYCAIGLCLWAGVSGAQILTHEDSLSAGLTVRGNTATSISGYGEARYTQNLGDKTGEANLDRAVLFVGHQFSSRIRLFTELEVEDAKVGQGAAGEVAMEQAFLKFDISKNLYLTAGLFTPRIGIINENHLPTTFNGVERPLVEQMVIPSTWREVGVSLYGSVPGITGLNYSFAMMNGLNAQGFSLNTGIREGRYEGSGASSRNKSVTGSLLYYRGGWRLQASSYAGGSIGLSDKAADRLGLSTGAFGTPVYLNEANVQYHYRGLALKALACIVNIPDARKINAAFANNTPEMMNGGYLELAYNLLAPFAKTRQLVLFSRYERINMNGRLPDNGVENKAFTQDHIIAGLTYMPGAGVVVKADFHLAQTGDFNTALVSNPDPLADAYQPVKRLINIGVGYSF